MSEVIELIGKTRLFAGIRLNISLISKTMPPVNAEVTIKCLWSAVLRNSLATCGTAMPMKPTGPQNAVVVPARIHVDTKTTLRETDVLTPMLLA